MELHTSHLPGTEIGAEGAAYLKRYHKGCNKKTCPICKRKWMGLETARATERLKAAKMVLREWKKPIHVVASPNPKMRLLHPQEQKAHAIKALRAAGIVGGMVIVHPWRGGKGKRWHISPHFHTIVYGRVVWNRALARKYGFNIINLGVRKSVPSTIYYQLSHAGVHDKYHTVTWFGCCSYAAMSEYYKRKKTKEFCIFCNHELVEMQPVYEYEPDPTLIYGQCWFLDDYRKWVDVPLRWG